MAAMNVDLGGLAGRPTTSQANPFESGAGPGPIRSGLGAYGEKYLGSSSEFMQSNVSCGCISFIGIHTCCLVLEELLNLTFA